MFNDRADGYADTAPVACYEPNALGLYDLIGNVWEWTASEYYPSHDFAAHADHPDGFDPAQPGEAVAVLKGGSHLCAPDYCMRYRPQARIGQSKGLGASHIGFRTITLDQPSPRAPFSTISTRAHGLRTSDSAVRESNADRHESAQRGCTGADVPPSLSSRKL
jgi:hypothetical protein